MRAIKPLFILFFVFLASIGIGANAFAYPEPICANKILDAGETNGIFERTSEHENRLYAVIKIGDESWYLVINYDDRKKFNRLKDKPVTVKYKLEQYWDEHDYECLREERLVSMVAAGENSSANKQAIQIEPGYFKASTTDAEPVNIFLASNGQGYAIGSGYENISWQQKGNSITIKGNIFIDQAAKVLSPTSFDLDGTIYSVDPNYKVTTYKYAESDFSGKMLVVWDSAPDILHIEFETVENSSGSTCEGQLVCETRDANVSCHKYGTDEPGNVTLKFSGNNLSVASSYSESDFCGKQGSFTGLYKK